MKKVFFATIAYMLFSSSAVAGETFSEESASWQDSYAKGRNAIDARDYSGATKCLEKAKGIAQNFKAGDSRLAATSSELMIIDGKINDRAKFVAHLLEQRDAYVRAFGANYCQVGMMDAGLATEYLDLGKPVEAEQHYKAAIAITEQNFGNANLKLAEMYHYCGVAQWQMGKPAEALQTIRKEEAVIQKSGAHCDQKLAGNLMMQANIMESLNKPKEAQSAWGKYYAIMARIDSQ
ncbi:MAG: tetratricopeptide repeat protein [Candidatus Obscuribacterales bacterium]|nr:tetratricopeptide repeat protein [Candidatus Obscuribacterales bacterium]